MLSLSHSEAVELLGAYALDALEPQEAAQVERHLHECVRCVVEVAQHHEVAGLLANSGGAAPENLWPRIAERLDAPSGIPSWDRLAARLDSLPARDLFVASVGPEEYEGPNSSEGTLRENAEVPGNIIPFAKPHRLGRLMTRSAIVVAAAAAVLALVLGVQVNHLNHQVSALNSSHMSVGAAAEAALENPTTQRVQLTTPPTSPGPKGTTVTLVIGHSGVSYVLASHLAPLPSSQTYQLWGAINGQLISLGVLGPDPKVSTFTYDPSVAVQAFAITAERGGGVMQTNHLPVVEGAVNA